MLLPWSFSSNDVSAVELNQENIGYYQQNPCEIAEAKFTLSELLLVRQGQSTVKEC